MAKKYAMRFIFITIFCSLTISSMAQENDSILVKAKNSKLIVYGEVIGKSEPTGFCQPPLICQVLVLRVTEVIKGTYKPQNIRVLFYFMDYSPFIDKTEKYVGLSRHFFKKDKTWILIFENPKPLKDGVFISEELENYKEVTLMKGYLDSIIPGNEKELQVMKQFIQCTEH